MAPAASRHVGYTSELVMNLLKSMFISTYITGAIALTALGSWQALAHGSLGWAGVFVAAIAPTLFFVRLFVSPVARTSAHLWPVILAGVVGLCVSWSVSAPSAAGASPSVARWCAGLVLLCGLAYVFWYSRFTDRNAPGIAVGRFLPRLEFEDLEGKTIRSDDLVRLPTVWIFFRGNWCPLCMAQVKEVAAMYRDIHQRGAQVALISPQSQGHTKSLARRFGVPFIYLRDRDNRAADRLGIKAVMGLPMGLQALGYESDLPLPTVLITGAGGAIVYADQTDNYRIRPEPGEFLRVLERYGAGQLEGR